MREWYNIEGFDVLLLMLLKFYYWQNFLFGIVVDIGLPSIPKREIVERNDLSQYERLIFTVLPM